MNKKNEKKVWAYIIRFSRRYILWILVSIAAAIVNIYADIYASDLLKRVIDISIGSNFREAKTFIIIGIAVFVLGGISRYLFRFFTDKFGNYVIRDIRSATIDYLGKLPPDYTMKNSRGDILAKLSGDAGVVQNFISGYFIDLIYIPIMIVFFGIYLAYLNFTLFLASFIILPVLIPLSYKLLAPIKASQREYGKQLGKTNNNIQNAIDGMGIIKAYNLEEEMAKKYDDSIRAATNTAFKNDKRQYSVEPLNAVVGSFPGIICVILGGFMSIDGKMTVGELLAFMNIFSMFIQPMNRLYHMMIDIKVSTASAERLFSILDETPEKAGSVKLTKEHYDRSSVIVSFSNVDFSFEEDRKILNKLNLQVSKGKHIALVGASGSGKTTILKLISKTHNAKGGNIKICGENIEDLDVESLRENIAYVSQSSFLFPFSVKDNILIGKPEATFEEVVEACKRANAHEFIEKLPEGYDTLVGERGSKLSGGQVQRISIARAMLKNAPIVLLDEATSALDTQSEVLVKEALDNLKKDTTLITVAHRLSTIEDADEILVLNQGIIIERGIHSELMAKNSAYAKLHLATQKEVS
jgi:ABC-type multidrug transport system fused ATPase/permease subunit